MAPIQDGVCHDWENLNTLASMSTRLFFPVADAGTFRMDLALGGDFDGACMVVDLTELAADSQSCGGDFFMVVDPNWLGMTKEEDGSSNCGHPTSPSS